MWERIDDLTARAPGIRALRLHRLELLEARRRRAAGADVGPELRSDEATAAVAELATPVLLERIRASWDGPLVLIKGPEVALDYPGPRLRRFGDLDLVAADAPAAQAALIAAGFQEVGDPAIYTGIHHLRPLWWPGLPLTVELHERPKWPDGATGPGPEEMLAASVPTRLGVAGIDTLAPAHHAVVLAAHAWAHEPLGRLGHLVDVATTLERADASEVRRLAARWGCSRLWRTTECAAARLLDGGRPSLALAVWARHLPAARERTVLEAHVADCFAPLSGRGRPRALRRETGEAWGAKLARAAHALAHARVVKIDHDLGREGHDAQPDAAMLPQGPGHLHETVQRL
jgi:hypothetical protein